MGISFFLTLLFYWIIVFIKYFSYSKLLNSKNLLTHRQDQMFWLFSTSQHSRISRLYFLAKKRETNITTCITSMYLVNKLWTLSYNLYLQRFLYFINIFCCSFVILLQKLWSFSIIFKRWKFLHSLIFIHLFSFNFCFFNFLSDCSLRFLFTSQC